MEVSVDALDLAPTRMLRAVPGRETFLSQGPAGAPIVIKRMLEGFALRRHSDGEVEYDNLRRLAADGLPVPRALDWSSERTGALRLGRRSVVVMERIEHQRTLREQLARAGAPERAELAAALLEVVVRLHEQGWYHRDLYLQHFVLRGESLVLLDVGRARKSAAVRRRWFVKDLAALLHSTPRAVGTRERLRFLARYLDARGCRERAARRRWLVEILAKERRMAAHRPRHGEERPWSDG